MDQIPIHICETRSDSKNICEESLKKFLKGVEIFLNIGDLDVTLAGCESLIKVNIYFIWTYLRY